MTSVDRLSEFFDAAAGNAAKQLSADTVLMKRLRLLHSSFATLTANLNEPQSPLAAVFALDVYSRLLGATLLTLSGQLREAYPVLRSGLDAGMYAIVFDDDASLREAWFARDQDKTALAKLRNGLTKSRMLEAVRRRDKALASRVEAQYEESIALGAHPNPMAVAGSLNITETPDRSEYLRPILGGTLLEVATTQGDVIHYGTSMLEMLIALFPVRSALLGIGDSVPQLKQPWAAG